MRTPSENKGGARKRPASPPADNGNVMLRLPIGLKARLAANADSQGVSLNQFCVALLSSSIGWQPGDTTTTTREDT